jgi:hypothetical protein
MFTVSENSKPAPPEKFSKISRIAQIASVIVSVERRAGVGNAHIEGGARIK